MPVFKPTQHDGQVGTALEDARVEIFKQPQSDGSAKLMVLVHLTDSGGERRLYATPFADIACADQPAVKRQAAREVLEQAVAMALAALTQ